MSQLSTYRRLFIPAFFIGYLLVGCAILPDFGMSWDEAAQRNHGIVAFDYINEVLDLGFEKQRPQSHLLRHSARHYGLWFPLLGYGLEQLLGLSENFRGRFLMRHYLVFFLFWGASIAFYRLLFLRFGDRKTALAGTGLFILSPRIFGHAFFNPKDIVFLATYTISTYTLLKFLKEKNIRAALLHALACAFVVNTRIPGVLIPAITVGILFVEWGQARFNVQRMRAFLPALVSFFVATPAFIFTLNPALWHAPAQQFGETFRTMSHFDWSNVLLYRGQFIKATELPWHYIPTWIAITTPPPFLILFAIGTAFIAGSVVQSISKGRLWLNANERTDLILFGLFFLPLAAIILKKSTLYDGWRQMFFVYPAFAGVATVGVFRLIKSRPGRRFRRVVWVFLLAGIGYAGAQIIQIHPFEYVYFNTFAGKEVFFKFERDYWGLSYKQAIETLAAKHPYSCATVKMQHYPGEENFRFLGPDIRQHLELRYGPEPAEFRISNYRGWKEMGDLKHRRHFYNHEVLILTAQGEPVVGIYRDPDY